MSRAGESGNHNMALRLEARAITTTHHDADQPPATAAVADVDEDELFELDIALLDGLGHHSRRSAAVAVADDDAGGHALLPNCLQPVRSVSSAVPVAASTSYPCSGYHSSRRLVFTGGVGRRFLGRSAPAGSSARLCFSSRGFETMGNYYFQRY